MNIEKFFKSSHSILVNGTPPCQNIMFPSQEHWQKQNPYYYQPTIHIPKKTSTTTLGEVGASVDMLRAQLTELSKRMEIMESKLSKLENSVSNDIFLLKSTLSEHATELLNSRDIVEDTHAHVKKTNNLIEQQDVCIDRLAGIVSQSRMRTVASNVDLGIIRRRLSRIEDFTGEFYEHFESFKSVKDIFSSLSDHINECDRDISMMVTKDNPMFETSFDNDDDDTNDNDNDDNDDTNHAGNDECDQDSLLTCIKNDQEQPIIQEEDDDFEKL
jgi:hypothetical protein